MLLVGPPFVLVALLTGKPVLLYRAGHVGVRLGLGLSGMRTEVEGVEHPAAHRAAVYAVNHASNVEPPILFDVLNPLFPRLRILYKAELRKLPVLVRAFDLAGFVPLERGNRDQSLPAIERAAAGAARGELVPDLSRRARAAGPASCCPSRRAGSSWRSRAQAPIVPVAIIGARDAMRKGSPSSGRSRLRVRLGTADRNRRADARRSRRADRRARDGGRAADADCCEGE